MNKNNEIYYVYVYIDPRNYEEFYYGKGKDERKNAHSKEVSGDSDKTKRIKAIKKAGFEPIIKVIARGLTEEQALLVEKTLIWKLGKTLTNRSSGHFAKKFRPQNSFHKDLADFDFENGLYYVNVGEGSHRHWADCKELGFLSAGQDKKWSKQIRTLNTGDIVVAYLKDKGYVGIGRVIEKAVGVSDFKIAGKPLSLFSLKTPNIFENCDNNKSEYLVKIEWIKAVEAKQAKWKKNAKPKLYATQLVKASLRKQQATRDFLEKEFGIKFEDYLK